MSCFDELCRLCAGKIDGLLSFNVLAPDHQQLLKKIMICLPIQVSECDKYPKFICMDCAFKLDMVFEFRERCLLTAQLFEEMISNDLVDVLNVQNAICNSNDIGSAISTRCASEEQKLNSNRETLAIDELNKNNLSSCALIPRKNLFQGSPQKVNEKETMVDKVSQNIKVEEEESLPCKKKSENKDKRLKCTECGKTCQSNYKLTEHMRRHTGEKPFCCSFADCKKSFRSKIGLAQHEASHSGQFELSCSTCGKGFQCKSYLKVHQRVHSDEKPFPCRECSRSFKTKQSLLDHTNRHLGVKPYLCDICGRGFITKGLCNSHQKTHSGQDSRQYPCHVCRKLFASKSYLRIHFKIHTGEKPFMCEVCGKGFLTRIDLRIHSTMHTGEKRYICETCGKAFARRDALRCHRRSHTGERPYKCDFCGQSFSQYSPMAIHKRLHTGERPYSCQDCPKAFVSRASLLAHRKKIHETVSEPSIDVELVLVKKEAEEVKVSPGSNSL